MRRKTRTTHNFGLLLLALTCTFDIPAPAAEPDAPLPRFEILKTPAGERFGLIGKKAGSPSPTLFIFATTVEQTLGSADFLKCGRELAERGCLCVSVDLPCHGPQRRENEPDGIAGWRTRLRHANPMAFIVARASVRRGEEAPTMRRRLPMRRAERRS